MRFGGMAAGAGDADIEAIHRRGQRAGFAADHAGAATDRYECRKSPPPRSAPVAMTSAPRPVSSAARNRIRTRPGSVASCCLKQNRRAKCSGSVKSWPGVHHARTLRAKSDVRLLFNQAHQYPNAAQSAVPVPGRPLPPDRFRWQINDANLVLFQLLAQAGGSFKLLIREFRKRCSSWRKAISCSPALFHSVGSCASLDAAGASARHRARFHPALFIIA